MKRFHWQLLVLFILIIIPTIILFQIGWGTCWEGIRDFVRAWDDM